MNGMKTFEVDPKYPHEHQPFQTILINKYTMMFCA